MVLVIRYFTRAFTSLSEQIRHGDGLSGYGCTPAPLEALLVDGLRSFDWWSQELARTFRPSPKIIASQHLHVHANVRHMLGRFTLAILLAVSVMGGPAAVAHADAAHEALTASGSLDWQPCDDPSQLPGFDCATLTRPLDRTKPNGKKVHLQVVRLPATGTPQQRIGSLLWNPGGPGLPGSSVAAVGYLLSPQMRASFDFVTWDPRGTGMSKPLVSKCGFSAAQRPATGNVNWNKVLDKRMQQMESVADRCRKANGDLLQHVGTVDNAYDMDALRKALGEDKVTYWGLSYGTVLLSTYLQLFPDNVRAVISDSSVDPQLSLLEWSQAATATDDSLGFWFETYPQEKSRFTKVLKKLNKQTISLPNGTKYTRWDLLDVIQANVPFSYGWDTVTSVIDNSYNAVFGQGGVRKDALAALQKPKLQSPRQDVNFTPIAPIVVCTDYSQRPGTKLRKNALNNVVRGGPWFGGSEAVANLAVCAGYGKKMADPVPRPKKFGPNIPGLEVHSTRDAETPYAWGVAMARAYRKMRMITLVGGHHANYLLAGSPCVNQYVDEWFLNLTMPAIDQTCPYPGASS